VDTGVPESALGDPKGWSTLPNLIVYHTDKTITTQLAKIGLKISDVSYVLVSHTHGDHIGNVKLFPDAKVLMRRTELGPRCRTTIVVHDPPDVRYQRSLVMNPAGRNEASNQIFEQLNLSFRRRRKGGLRAGSRTPGPCVGELCRGRVMATHFGPAQHNISQDDSVVMKLIVSRKDKRNPAGSGARA
jgi:hypothetical protein